ncbi:hypothetical protein FBQ81_15090 [Chloroflexi bacterium CFX6]|nr:hypothetical protein [Chloroflexi bacterium CFX6]
MFLEVYANGVCLSSRQFLARAGYSMHAALTIGQLLEYWEENKKVGKDKIEETRKFLNESG